MLRKVDETVDALIEVLTGELAAGPAEAVRDFLSSALVEAIANRVVDRLAQLHVLQAPLDSVPKMVHTEV